MCAKNSSDEILDLTEVVKVGESRGVSGNSSYSENDVLDSLVNELEVTPVDQDKETSTQDDEVLDLTNLDSLISSYNLDNEITVENKDENNLESEENFDSILNDIKLELDNDTENTTDVIDTDISLSMPSSQKEDILSRDIAQEEIKADNLIDAEPKKALDDDPFDIDKHYPPSDLKKEFSSFNINEQNSEEKGLPFDLDVPLSSLDNKIAENVVDNDFELDLNSIKESLDLDKDTNQDPIITDDIDALTNDIINGPQPVEEPKKQMQEESFPDFDDELNALDKENKKVVEKETQIEMPVFNTFDVDDTINNAISEVSLDHDDMEQGFVGELKEDFDSEPAMDFFEKPEDREKNNALLQSAAELFKADKNNSEQHDAHENSLEVQVQAISTNIASLQQRFVNSDSKWQVTNLELTNRISLIESRLSEYEVFSQKELLGIKELVDSSIRNVKNDDEEIATKQLLTRLSVVEAKLLKLDTTISTIQTDSTEEILARINTLEAKVLALDTNVVESQADNLEEIVLRLSELETKVAEQNKHISEIEIAKNEELTNKVKFVEDRLAKLDDIFAEQKMLNDELAKKMDTQETSNIDELQNKILLLEEQLKISNEKIANLEINLEKAVSLAAAKVLREEIIPLFAK